MKTIFLRLDIIIVQIVSVLITTTSVSAQQTQGTTGGTTTIETKALDGDTFYEPYWAGGDWVFDRYTTLTTTVDPDDTTTKYRTRTATTTTKTILTASICGTQCPWLFTVYGEICALRYTTDPNYLDARFDIEQKTFQNLCFMMDANICPQDTNPEWFAIYRGKCHYTKLNEIYAYDNDVRYTHTYLKTMPKTVLSNQVKWNSKGMSFQKLDWNWYSLGVSVYHDRQHGGGKMKKNQG